MKKSKKVIPYLFTILIIICLMLSAQVWAWENGDNDDFVIKPIEDAPCGIAGFLGTAERGPTTPKLVTSWTEYQKIFGINGSNYGYLSYVVKSFFDNGGMKCYIVRIVRDSAKTAMAHISFDNIAAFKVEAVGEGTWGNNIFLKVVPSKASTPKEFLYDIEVSYKKGTISLPSRAGNLIKSDLAFSVREEYYNVSLNENSENYIEKSINGISNLVVFKKEKDINPKDKNISIYHLEGGNDGAGKLCKEDFIRQDTLKSDYSKGLAGLSKCKDISILYSPDSLNIQGLTEALVAECEDKKDRFLIVDSLQGDRNPKPREISKSKYAAFYYPWIKIHDLSNNSEKLIPPGGAVAGAIVRNDSEYGVHKASANKPISGITGLEFSFDIAEIDMLKQNGVNPIVNMIGRGFVIYGNITLSEDVE